MATRYGCQLQGATAVALTNGDVLGYLSEIPIATAYKIRGQLTTAFPATADLMEAEPVFETMPGWHTDISQIQSYQNLPAPARRYIERIEQLVETPISFVSNGPRREQMMVR